MKHASATALHGLAELLERITVKEGIKEKKLGIFYRKSKSFLHFHEDTAGVFADLRVGADFERYAVNTKKEWKALLTAIDRAVCHMGEPQCGERRDTRSRQVRKRSRMRGAAVATDPNALRRRVRKAS